MPIEPTVTIVSPKTVSRGGIPLLSLIGGKWTTFRAFGERAADQIFLHLDVTRRTGTAGRDYPGAIGFPRDEMSLARAGNRWRPVSTCPWKGQRTSIPDMAPLPSGSLRSAPKTPDQPLANLPSFTRNEIVWLIRARAAIHLDDLIFRRSR